MREVRRYDYFASKDKSRGAAQTADASRYNSGDLDEIFYLSSLEKGRGREKSAAAMERRRDKDKSTTERIT